MPEGTFLGETYSRQRGESPRGRLTDFLDKIGVIDFTLSDARKAGKWTS